MTGAVILAAGGSIRLGQPKQFLVYRGRSLIQRAVDAAAECSPVVVVAGREWERVQQELQAREVCVVQNAEWEHGIGSSIRAGVERALEIAPGVEALVILVCDQPFVTPEVVTALRVSREKGGKRGAACSYGGSLGVPAIFARSLFAELLSLRDDCGARLFRSWEMTLAGWSLLQGLLISIRGKTRKY